MNKWLFINSLKILFIILIWYFIVIILRLVIAVEGWAVVKRDIATKVGHFDPVSVQSSILGCFASKD